MSEYNYQPLIPTRKPTFTSYVQCGSNEPTTPPQEPKITSYVKVDADETYTLLYLKKDTEANWLANSSYIPKAGEPCLTLDGEFAHQIKFGDGVKTWGELPYSGVVKANDIDLSGYATTEQLKEFADSALQETKDYVTEVANQKANAEHDHNDVYYTKSEFDSMELISVDDIDAICGTSIQVASASGVTF